MAYVDFLTDLKPFECIPSAVFQANAQNIPLVRIRFIRRRFAHLFQINACQCQSSQVQFSTTTNVWVVLCAAQVEIVATKLGTHLSLSSTLPTH